MLQSHAPETGPAPSRTPSAPSPVGPLRKARVGLSASKGHSPRDVPRPREPAIERRQPDPPEAAAGGSGDRPGDGGPVGRERRDEQAAARARSRRRGGEPS